MANVADRNEGAQEGEGPLKLGRDVCYALHIMRGSHHALHYHIMPFYHVTTVFLDRLLDDFGLEICVLCAMTSEYSVNIGRSSSKASMKARLIRCPSDAALIG